MKKHKRGNRHHRGCHSPVIQAWFVAPVGSITEPVTFVAVPGVAAVQILLGDLSSARQALEEASRETGVPLIAVDGVEGLAATDPYWDGQPVFICSNPRCGKVHDVHLMAAENLFARTRGGR